MKIKFLLSLIIPLIISFNLDAAEVSSVEVLGKAKMNGLLQTWFVDDSTAANPNVTQSFKIRRSEIKFSGNLTENTAWFVMMDFAKSISTTAGKDSKALQDLGITLSLFPFLDLTVGQFKTPTNWESSRSSGDLPLAERSMVTRKFGDRRDIGAMLTYKFLDTAKLSLMYSNGMNSQNTSTNVDETNSQKDLHHRVECGLFNGLTLGLYGGHLLVGDEGATSERSHGGLDLQYNLDPWMAAFDFIDGKEGTTSFKGNVATLAYKVLANLQIVARHDFLLTQTTTELTSEATAVSLNYLIHKTHAEIQLSYFDLKNAKGSGGKYEVSAGQNGNTFVLAFQTKF